MAHSTTCPPIYEQSIYSSSSSTKAESVDGLSMTSSPYDHPHQNGVGGSQMSNSRISLNSISPPISPMTPISYTDVANLRRPVQQSTGSNERLHKSVSFFYSFSEKDPSYLKSKKIFLSSVELISMRIVKQLQRSLCIILSLIHI